MHALRRTVRKLRAAGRGHVRLRALPAAPAQAPLRRGGEGDEEPGAVRAGELLIAADGSPSMTTWGNVIMPVSWTSSARPSGSLARLTSV